MIFTWPLITHDIALGLSKTLLAIFSLTEVFAVFLFIYNIRKTMKTPGQ